MARATQGLQIALIISVMLNVVLGVTTYLFNKQAFENLGKATAAASRETEANKKAQTAEEKFDRARKAIGLADLDIDQIEKKVEDRQQAFGVATAATGDATKAADKPVGAPGYDPMVERLFATVDDRTTQLKSVKAQVADLEAKFKSREAAKDAAVAAIDQGFQAEKIHYQQAVANNQAQIQAMVRNQANTVAQVAASGKALSVRALNAESTATAREKLLREKEQELEKAADALRKHDAQIIDPPSGKITQVSLNTKTVWIDKGRADSLPRGIRFTVYAAESNSSAKAVEKGTVEVTQIYDNHAECRIVDDKFGDPITAGDKIFTAFWAPGQQRHFALCGIMNLDGDGHNQVNTAIGLVKIYGGVVDCWLDEQGHMQGKIIPLTTQYIIKGDLPDKGTPEMKQNNTVIESDAAKNKLHEWTLSEFKQQVNYQKSSSVENFGVGASSSGDAERPTAAPKAAPKAKAPADSKAADDVFGGK